MDGATRTRARTHAIGTQSDVDESTLIDVRGIGRIIRRRALVIGVILAVAAALALVAYMLAERRYVATAQVALERTAEKVIAEDQVTPTVDPDSAAVDTEVEALRSPALIGTVVDTLRLDRNADFNGGLAIAAAPNAKPDPIARARAIGNVLGNLTVKRDGLSYAISISYESPSPTLAAQIVNTIAQTYVAGQVGTKSGATKRASRFLEGRLQQMRGQVLAAEKAVADFRAANSLFAVSNLSTVSQDELSNLSTQLAQAKAENAAAQARLSTARAQLARGRSGEELGEALDSPVVSQLRAQRAEIGREVASLQKRYGPLHPDLQRAEKAQANTDAQIAAEVRRIVANTSIQANIASQRAASLQGSIGRAEGKLAADNNASVRLNELERNAESARTLYRSFLDRYRQTVAQEGLEQSDSYIVATARVPAVPSSPNLLLYAAAALVGGLGIAALVVLLLQLLERGLETSDAIEKRLGLPVLASIPDANTLPEYRKGGLPAQPMDLVLQRPQSLLAEAFRSLRTSIQFATPDLRHRVIAIASSVPGEGKTTTAICLARTAAAAGITTLLIDCDPRRRATSRQFGGQVKAGLNEVLAGSAQLDQVLVKDTATGAWLLPQRIDAAELTLTEGGRFAALLAQLRERFELILLDTAPVLAIDEARVVASLADGVVFLLRWRTTPAKAAEIALNRLADVDANVLGVAQTQVNVVEQARAGFGDAGYYYRDVESYHTA
ncbi:GumC family protein [Sphingomonas sp. EC-HK361]|uniref:GumC family protein n=1 Tax=Sphingomonas sp. EC-HK361 TaxID=2038397 RepID=UPI00125FD76F|nr:AAA family ATPase [Sphingomonas sp. EC-HK361]